MNNTIKPVCPELVKWYDRANIIDISWPISPDMTSYKDIKIVTFTPTKTLEKDHARETKITLGAHSGTHIDAPAHFIKNGHTIDNILLQKFVGPCRVIELTEITDHINAQDLEKHAIQEQEIILLKTQNSLLNPTHHATKSFIYLDHSAARYLAEKKIKSVGIDYLGIERNQPDHETHITLLNNNIPIIEGLRLAHAPAGNYLLCCLPLAVQNLEASPARAILFQ